MTHIDYLQLKIVTEIDKKKIAAEIPQLSFFIGMFCFRPRSRINRYVNYTPSAVRFKYIQYITMHTTALHKLLYKESQTV